jgi:hypothetical protein
MGGVFAVHHSLVLATSVDGRLSLIVSLPLHHRIEVWVLVGGGWWSLQRKIHLLDLLPDYCPEVGFIQLSGFCQWSGCLFGNIAEKSLLITVDKGSLRPTARFDAGPVHM